MVDKQLNTSCVGTYQDMVTGNSLAVQWLGPGSLTDKSPRFNPWSGN